MSLKVYVGNYPNSFTQKDIVDLFRDFEGITLLKFIQKENKSFSFMVCVDQEQVVDVVTSMHDIDVCGRNLVVRAGDEELQNLISESFQENKVFDKHPKHLKTPSFDSLKGKNNYGINFKPNDEVVSEFSDGVRFNNPRLHFSQTAAKNIHQKLNRQATSQSEWEYKKEQEQENNSWERPTSSASYYNNANPSNFSEQGSNSFKYKQNDDLRPKEKNLVERDSGIQNQSSRDSNYGRQSVSDYNQSNFERMHSRNHSQSDFNNGCQSTDNSKRSDFGRANSQIENQSRGDLNKGYQNMHHNHQSNYDLASSGFQGSRASNNGCQSIQTMVKKMSPGAHSQSKGNYNNDSPKKDCFKQSNLNREGSGMHNHNTKDFKNARQNISEFAQANSKANSKSLYQQDSGILSHGQALGYDSKNNDSNTQYDQEIGIRSPRSKGFNEEHQKVGNYSPSASSNHKNINFEADPMSYFEENPGPYIKSPKDFKVHRNPGITNVKNMDITSPGSSDSNTGHKSVNSSKQQQSHIKSRRSDSKSYHNKSQDSEYYDSNAAEEEIVSKEDLFYVSVANFPLYTDIQDLYNLFEDLDPYNIVMICNLPRHDKTPTEAIICFKTQNQATDAIITFDNTSYYGRGLVVTDASDISMVPALLSMGWKDAL